jgi:hypothetical protein
MMSLAACIGCLKLIMPWRTNGAFCCDNSMLSVRLSSGTAPRPGRSSGTRLCPSSRRASGRAADSLPLTVSSLPPDGGLHRTGCQQFLLTITGNPGDTNDFTATSSDPALMPSQMHALSAGRQCLYRSRTSPGAAVQACLLNGVADHHARQAGCCFLARIAMAGDFAHAHHGRRMAQFTDFIELMADI